MFYEFIEHFLKSTIVSQVHDKFHNLLGMLECSSVKFVAFEYF